MNLCNEYFRMHVKGSVSALPNRLVLIMRSLLVPILTECPINNFKAYEQTRHKPIVMEL
ncbi:hypothetical protein [Cohnella sp.]|uniref:hypothetical protein n=1 Tax=Cohnella sp. TaxID=1883426 RepID=UPI003567F6A7